MPIDFRLRAIAIPFIPQNIFLLQKYNFYMKAAKKFTEILQIKIFFFSLQRIKVLRWHHGWGTTEEYALITMRIKMLLLFCYFVKVKTFWGVNDSTRSKRNVIYKYYII